jgi:hypothetical protein
MQIVNLIVIIVFGILMIGCISSSVYWGYFAWRHPAELKAKLIARIEQRFGIYLWMYRILMPAAALVSLVVMVFVILIFLGYIK